jgi:hypothetical protein
MLAFILKQRRNKIKSALELLITELLELFVDDRPSYSILLIILEEVTSHDSV